MSDPERAASCVTLDGISARAELHFHLLPGIDDGPSDMAEAVVLARMALDDGTGVVVATPHVRDVLHQALLPELGPRVEAVRAALRREGVALDVRQGGELAQNDVPRLRDRDLEAIAQGPPGARWVLLEAPLFSDDLDGFLAATAEVRARGFGTLIGHPERCRALMASDEAIDAELRAGARLQVNGSSLTGRHGAQIRAEAVALVRSGRVDVLASDAHRPTRGPVHTAALAALAEAGIAGPAVDALAGRNPRALLERGLPAAPAARAA